MKKLTILAASLGALASAPARSEHTPHVELADFTGQMCFTTSEKGDKCGRLAKTALQYNEAVTRLTTIAKQRKLVAADWEPVKAVINVEKFRRVGPFREVLNWSQYVQMITEWAGKTDFEKTFYGVTEIPGRAIIELEERNTTDGKLSVINSASFFTFDKDGKIVQLDIYMQSPTFAERK